MASTSGGGHRNGLNAGASLEKLMELAHSTGDLVLTCRNLKSFPKNRCKYDLKDTVSVGKKMHFYSLLYLFKVTATGCCLKLLNFDGRNFLKRDKFAPKVMTHYL